MREGLLSPEERHRLAQHGLWSRIRVDGPRLARGVVLGRKFEIAELLRVERGVKVFISHGTLRAGRLAHLAEDVRIGVHGVEREAAVFSLGERSSLGARTVVNAGVSVQIGAHTLISSDCRLTDGDFHEIYDEAGTALGPVNRPIVIGHHVWLGMSVIVLKGVTIGDHAVVGAGSVVTRDIPAQTLAVGNPARPVKSIGGWR